MPGGWISRLSIGQKLVLSFSLILILLAGSPMVSRLRHLGLSCTGLNHRGVEALVASPHLGALETLDLTQTQLHRKSCRLLKERFPEVLGSPI